MRIIFKLLLIAILLGGCATAKKTYTSDGKEGYSITCSGSALNWGMCYEKAGEICGSKGYEVLEKMIKVLCFLEISLDSMAVLLSTEA